MKRIWRNGFNGSAAIAVASLMAGCMGGDPIPAAPGVVAPAAIYDNGPGHAHMMPVSHGQTRRAENAPAGAHLTYYGGPVVSHAKVYTIFWGSSTQFQSQLNAFYTGITNSIHFDWLSEYNTTNPPQTIGRGSFIGSHVITSPPGGNNITDTQLENELLSLINAGTVPANDGNTIYMMHFAPGITITRSNGSQSCQVFCAYHHTTTRNGGDVFYGVVPDQGGACAGGCGTDPSLFNNTTTVSSHELIETVTDPAVSLATTFAAPLSWYDQNYSEIGDICNGQPGTIVGGNGITYVVQQEFSNVANDCIVSRVVTNDFSVSVTPSSHTVQAPGSATYTVSTALVSGSAQTISLSISGLPAGVTGSFNPTSVTAGNSSTLTISVAATASAATSSLTIKGTATSGSHTAGVTLVVTKLATNDFSLALAPASRTVAAPSSTTYAITTAVTNGSAQTVNLSVSGLPSGVTGSFNPTSVTAGGSSTLTVTAAASAAASNSTLTITGTGPSATHTAGATLIITNGTGTQLITNGGFETGNFSGWTQANGVTAVTNTFHGGKHSATVGSANAVSGDSTLYQQIAIPASGTTTLAFWYLLSSSDTYTYDQQEAYITDTSGTRLATIFSVCKSQGWTQATFDLTPYKGKTVRVTFHTFDDNFAGDPTFLRVDDVSALNR